MGLRRTSHSSAGVRSTLDGTEARLGPLDRAIIRAEWNLYTGRSRTGPARLQQARSRLLREPHRSEFVERALLRTDDALLVRRLVLLRRAIRDALVEQDPQVIALRDRMQRRIVGFRPTWDGKRVNRAVLNDIVRTDPDPGRRKRAFYAEDPLHRAIEDDLRELIELRNDRARSIGVRSYPALRLEFEGLTSARLTEFARAASAAARDRLRAIRDDFLTTTGSAEWFPWDLPYARERRASLPKTSFPGRTMIPSIRSALGRWGFDSARLNFPVVRHDLPFGGLTFAISIPDDVRVLVHPRDGWEYYMVLFHEFGHAVHFRSIRQPSHLLRNPELGFAAFAEGVADLFEEIASSEAWLEACPGISRSAARRFRHGRGDENLVRATGVARATDLELAMYAHPDRDPSGDLLRSARRLYGFGDYSPRSWVEDLFVTHPVYIQSYLLSLMFRKQVVGAMVTATGGDVWPNPRAARWLTESWFQAGARYDWIPQVREVTGRPFGPDDLVRSIARREP